MPSGLEFFNDDNSVILSTEVTPVCLHEQIDHTLTTSLSSSIPLHEDDGYLSVFYIDNPPENFYDYGFFSPAGTDGRYYILPDNLSSGETIAIKEYKFKLGLSKSANQGLQLFNANGDETYNSNNLPINILERYSIKVSDCWLKNSSGQFTGQYTNKFVSGAWSGKKIGILFTNMPTGIIKFSNSANVYAYDIRASMKDGTLVLMYWVDVWLQSFSSVSIPIDESVRLDFFIVDLTNY
ncbi:hypothetical protein [Pseudoalteromonas nigrifaciens]|uniref:hypothetical protein n=1 Tax=Pseudoalteromonas nigrifaciens TaxID=28109 RepID=UPI0035620B9A